MKCSEVPSEVSLAVRLVNQFQVVSGHIINKTLPVPVGSGTNCILGKNVRRVVHPSYEPDFDDASIDNVTHVV